MDRYTDTYITGWIHRYVGKYISREIRYYYYYTSYKIELTKMYFCDRGRDVRFQMIGGGGVRNENFNNQ